MPSQGNYLDQRLSLKNQTCTVRYIGPVADKTGEWLGVEWDDTSRGKHNGEHAGRKYFQCASSSSTAASFLRPKQPWDEPRTFLQALRAKYVDGGSNAGNAEIVYISGKQAEEIGFEKFAKRQAALRGIHVLVLDRMRIQHTLTPSNETEDDRDEISAICAGITDLDISYNLFETFEEIVDLCARLPKLRSLALHGNRFEIGSHSPPGCLPGIHMLGLSNTLLYSQEISSLVVDSFGGVKTLMASSNEWQNTDFASSLRFPGVHTLDLSSNLFTSFSEFHDLVDRDMRVLLLKHNPICQMAKADSLQALFAPNRFQQIEEIDLSHNLISNMFFFDMLSRHFPALKHLRVTGNPVYQTLKASDGKPLTAEDGYMLTIARLPQIETLNYSQVGEKERINAEAYYLKQIAAEVSSAPEDQTDEIIRLHPRWHALCEEYGQPRITRSFDKSGEDPNSIAARLLKVSFRYASGDEKQAWVEELPKALNIYSVLGMLGKRLDVRPLTLRLVWETNERDPVGQGGLGYSGPDWWDSDEDTADEDTVDSVGESARWVKREVELVAGTRTLGTYVEGKEARIRIETIATEPR